MRCVAVLGLALATLVAVCVLYASPAGSAQDPRPKPRADLAIGRGTTALHRFDFSARGRIRPR